MGETALGACVLVPVANPASVPPLLAWAARIAAADQGRVEVVTVLSPHAPADEHAYAWQGMAEAESHEVTRSVAVRGRVVHAEDSATGVLQAMSDSDASLVLMGWRGRSSTSDVFGRLIDRIVGRSTVPLGILRIGTSEPRRVLLPISADHLLPGGRSGLALASELARRLDLACDEPATVLRTGPRDEPLPEIVESLGDRVHHDPRRNHQAVGAFARPDDLIVAAVAPTVSGLRGATTHLAWAAPDATLLVAVDVGPSGESGLASAVEEAGQPAPDEAREPVDEVRIVVTVRLREDGAANPEAIERVLRAVGTTEHVMTWWPAGDPSPHVRATLVMQAPGPNRAIAAAMTAVHDAPELAGAEISYDVERPYSADATA